MRVGRIQVTARLQSRLQNSNLNQSELDKSKFYLFGQFRPNLVKFESFDNLAAFGCFACWSPNEAASADFKLIPGFILAAAGVIEKKERNGRSKMSTNFSSFFI